MRKCILLLSAMLRCAAFLSSFCLFVVTFKVKKVMYFLVLLWIVGMPPNLLIPSHSYSLPLLSLR